MKIGFIGLGVMGAPMARNLVQAGHELVTCLRRSPLPDDLSADVRESPRDVAAEVNTVITMLPDTPDVEKVLLGPDGVIEGLGGGALVIDMSSVSPLETKRFADAIIDKGNDYVDAPVSGGEIGAKAGTLTIMAGGTKDAFARARPLVELLGKTITHVGERAGDGQICKIANQIIVALNIEAVSEALVFASKAGCDPARVREALMGGFASSRILEVHGEKMIARTFDGGFRLRLHRKDLRLALESARGLNIALPNTATAQELINSCIANGGAEEDHSGLVKALEALSAHQIA